MMTWALRYDRGVATSLRAAVNKREQQLYQEYLTQLRLKDRKFFHTPAGTVGPSGLERGLIKATDSGANFEGGVVGFYGEWSDTLAKLPEVIIKNLQNMHEKSLPPTGARRRIELEYQDLI